MFNEADGGKMLLLADWIDMKDDQAGYTGPREVQADLRRWADEVADLLDGSSEHCRPKHVIDRW